MNKTKNIIIALFAVLLISGCSTDVKVAAPYKEIPVVVGLLNKNDNIHYIKVNKAFLNEDGSPYTAGSVLDSNLYPYPLSVKLYALNASGVKFDSVSLDTVHIQRSGSGTFLSNNVYYATPYYKLKYINVSGKDTTWAKYKVEVRKASDNKLIASAQCGIVSEIRFGATPREIDIYNPNFSANVAEYKKQSLSWIAPRNGKRYSGVLRFKFRVQNDGTGEDYLDSVDMQLMQNNRLNSNDNNTPITFVLFGADFYGNLQLKLDPLPSSYRRVYVAPLEFHLEFGGEELDTYMELNNSSLGLSEVVPEYTNIDGGYGLFSSRVKKVFNDIRQVNLSLNSIYGLKENAIVGRKAGANDLGFR